LRAIPTYTISLRTSDGLVLYPLSGKSDILVSSVKMAATWGERRSAETAARVLAGDETYSGFEISVESYYDLKNRNESVY